MSKALGDAKRGAFGADAGSSKQLCCSSCVYEKGPQTHLQLWCALISFNCFLFFSKGRGLFWGSF